MNIIFNTVWTVLKCTLILVLYSRGFIHFCCCCCCCCWSYYWHDFVGVPYGTKSFKIHTRTMLCVSFKLPLW